MAVPIATTATADEVAHAIRETGAPYAVVAPEWRGRDLVRPLVAESELPGLRQVIVLGDDPIEGAVRARLLRTRSDPLRPPARPMVGGLRPLHIGLDGSAQGGAAQSRDAVVRARCRARRRQQPDAGDLPGRPCGLADRSSPAADGRWDNGRDGPLERPGGSRTD